MEWTTRGAVVAAALWGSGRLRQRRRWRGPDRYAPNNQFWPGVFQPAASYANSARGARCSGIQPIVPARPLARTCSCARGPTSFYLWYWKSPIAIRPAPRRPSYFDALKTTRDHRASRRGGKGSKFHFTYPTAMGTCCPNPASRLGYDAALDHHQHRNVAQSCHCLRRAELSRRQPPAWRVSSEVFSWSDNGRCDECERRAVRAIATLNEAFYPTRTGSAHLQNS